MAAIHCGTGAHRGLETVRDHFEGQHGVRLSFSDTISMLVDKYIKEHLRGRSPDQVPIEAYEDDPEPEPEPESESEEIWYEDDLPPN